MAGSIYLKDCHRNMKPLPYSVYEVTLLPAIVVRAPKSEEEMVRFESAHSVFEGRLGVSASTMPVTGCAQRVQMAEHGIQPLVRLVCGTVDV
jgi:hypothetical protein